MRQFRIQIDESLVSDLQRRLEAVRWPEIPFDTGWSAGTSNGVLRELVQYWRFEFDWSAIQERLNRLHHLRGSIQGEEMHCVVWRPSGAQQPYPLLLLHGWPSSFLEFSTAAPLLAAGTSDRAGFEVVAPSLPGFTFSEAPRGPGMTPSRIAERMHLLMKELGYERYGVHGGDWGALIGEELALQQPDAVVGLHLLGVPSWAPPPADRSVTREEHEFLERWGKPGAAEKGYSLLQGTKPQTLAYALQDSPVGLLAWLLEKYWGWSDHEDDLWEVLPRDYLLSTVSLYWFTGCALSAARIYYEYRQDRKFHSESRIAVPTSFALFPGDPWEPPLSLVQPGRFSRPGEVRVMPSGGHFPAIEQPRVLAEDVLAFFSGCG